MKKLVCLIAVLALTAPLFAAQSVLTLSASAVNGSQLQVGYASNDANVPVGISFKVALSDGATVNSSADVVSSLSTAFNANIDYANSAGTAYTALGQGHPLAKADAPGEVVFPAGTFAVCMGSLLQSPAAPPASTANLITLQAHQGTAGTASATISADTAGRGGSVGKGTAFSVVYPAAAVTLTFECFPTGNAKYAEWVSVGKPNCWCFARQCHGDADGLKQGATISGFWYVGSNDLAVLVSAWQIKEPTKGPGLTGNQICADFARDKQGATISGFWRVGSNDLALLVASWQVKEPTKGPGVPGDCGGTL